MKFMIHERSNFNKIKKLFSVKDTVRIGRQATTGRKHLPKNIECMKPSQPQNEPRCKLETWSDNDVSI